MIQIINAAAAQQQVMNKNETVRDVQLFVL
jgi:hypothetical protein